MFANENVTEKAKNELELNDVKPIIMANFIHFLYSDELVNPSLYSSLDLLILADKYKIVGLRKECEKALAKSVSTSNAITFLCSASRIEAPLLAKRSANFIFKNLDTLIGSVEWNEMVETNPRVMNQILQNRSA
jgi:hypothetical protein